MFQNHEYDLFSFQVRTPAEIDSYYRLAVVPSGQLPKTEQWRSDSEVGFQVHGELWEIFYRGIELGRLQAQQGTLYQVDFLDKWEKNVVGNNGDTFILRRIRFQTVQELGR